jgi:hypothetical protein
MTPINRTVTLETSQYNKMVYLINLGDLLSQQASSSGSIWDAPIESVVLDARRILPQFPEVEAGTHYITAPAMINGQVHVPVYLVADDLNPAYYVVVVPE